MTPYQNDFHKHIKDIFSKQIFAFDSIFIEVC